MRQLALALLIAVSLVACGDATPPTPVPVIPVMLVPWIDIDPGAQADTARAERHRIPLALAREIRLASTKHSIPQSIAYGLVRAESYFNAAALSWAGARGLIQVMPATGEAHCGLDPDSLYIAPLNLDCGYSYLSMMYERFGRWDYALMAYNRGPARMMYELANGKSHGTSEPYAEQILSDFSSKF